jgi:hypothetical protein
MTQDRPHRLAAAWFAEIVGYPDLTTPPATGGRTDTDGGPSLLEFMDPSKRYPNNFIPEGGQNRVAADMLLTKMRSMLSGLWRGRWR